MNQLYKILFLCCIFVISGCTSSLLDRNAILLTSFDDNCPRECYLGIIPSTTTEDQFLQIIDETEEMRFNNIEQEDYNSVFTTIYTWRDEALLAEGRAYVDTRTSIISNISLSFDNGIPIETVIEKFGLPDKYRVDRPLNVKDQDEFLYVFDVMSLLVEPTENIPEMNCAWDQISVEGIYLFKFNSPDSPLAKFRSNIPWSAIDKDTCLN